MFSRCDLCFFDELWISKKPRPKKRRRRAQRRSRRHLRRPSVLSRTFSTWIPPRSRSRHPKPLWKSIWTSNRQRTLHSSSKRNSRRKVIKIQRFYRGSMKRGRKSGSDRKPKVCGDRLPPFLVFFTRVFYRSEKSRCSSFPVLRSRPDCVVWGPIRLFSTFLGLFSLFSFLPLLVCACSRCVEHHARLGRRHAAHAGCTEAR